uniref:Cytochrome P450 n=1 Tax=Sinopodophyllum hexandrum TaxID=93608 RepID=A0A0N9HQY0_SINHE|nr:cytochrome P450 [Sinopodophyllum hexandrum]
MISTAWLWFWDTWNETTGNYPDLSTFLSLLALVALSCYVFLIKKPSKDKAPLPPGPRGLPIVGNLPFLDPELHSYFAKLAEKYGPVIKVRLGSKLCIVFSSPAVAKEVLKDYDATFADRDQSAMGLALSYGGVDLGVAPYGDHWRMLRKLCVKELINHTRLTALYDLRRREARRMINRIYTKIGSPLSLNEEILLTTFNFITNMMWGGTLEKEEMSRLTTEFRLVVHEMIDLMGKPNISDYFPALAPFDLQGLEPKMKKNVIWFEKIFQQVIDRRREMESQGEGQEKEGKDFLQILLQLIEQGDQKTPFTLTHLKALFLDLILAGTKTTATAVEWAVSELIKQPVLMKKAKQELDEVVGMNNIVEESHLPKLQYIEAVMKEVLRLHPPGTLLLPRTPKESCIIGGYMIPKGAMVFVNVWAIQRNPEYWVDPLEFRPERFLNSTWDLNGSDLRYFPFGSGRRMCAGVPLAERQTSYLLASLLHSFDWELPEGEKLDLTEAFGMEMTKKIPLVAIPTPRLFEPRLYT